MRTVLALVAGILIASGVMGGLLVGGSAIRCWTFLRSHVEFNHEPSRVWWK